MSNMESGEYGMDRQGDVQHDVDLLVDTRNLPHIGHDVGPQACSQVLQPASLHEQGGPLHEHVAQDKASCYHLKSEIALICTDSLHQQHPHYSRARVLRDEVHPWVQQAHPQQGQGVRGGHGHGRGGRNLLPDGF